MSGSVHQVGATPATMEQRECVVGRRFDLPVGGKAERVFNDVLLAVEGDPEDSGIYCMGSMGMSGLGLSISNGEDTRTVQALQAAKVRRGEIVLITRSQRPVACLEVLSVSRKRVKLVGIDPGSVPVAN